MRQITIGLGFLLLAGCTNFPMMRSNPAPPPPAQVPNEVPSPESLIGYLNFYSQQVQSIDVKDLDLDARQDGQGAGLRGWLVCQKPRNFRLVAKVVANPEIDMGSNNDEFWYWIRRMEPHPYLFHCSYGDLNAGRARLPFPFQPEWVMEALGMAEYSANDSYRVQVKATTLELVKETRSPQGAPVRKVTVFQRAAAPFPKPQVVAHVLQDAQGHEICSAKIVEVQRVGNAVIPKQVVLTCPAEKMELKMWLGDAQVNDRSVDQRAARLFGRPQMSGIILYDLARGPEAEPVKRAGLFRR
jgi:hypothetical protein